MRFVEFSRVSNQHTNCEILHHLEIVESLKSRKPIWLVVWKMLYFPYIWNNHPIDHQLTSYKSWDQPHPSAARPEAFPGELSHGVLDRGQQGLYLGSLVFGQAT